MNQTGKPLAGVKVMDLTIYVAGPATSTMLGYLGADVIKVEPLKGDPYRGTGKGYNIPAEPKNNPLYDHCNGYKRGIALDFRSDEGKEALRRIAASADIIVTNYRDKPLASMGMTYEEVRKYNPGVVYGVFSGYGDKGPDAERPGFDATSFFSRSGFAMRGTYKGLAPLPPTVSGAGDNISSMALAIGLLGAYVRKQSTGEGEKVSSSLYGTALWCLGVPMVQAQYGYIGPFPREAPGFSSLSNDYECKDGMWIRVCGMSAEKNWKPMCVALGIEEYSEDPRFCTSAEQFKNISAACQLLQENFLKWDSEEIYQRLVEVDIPVEYDCRIENLTKDQQALENNFITPYTYENGKQTYFCMAPFKMSSVDDSYHGRGPYLGEQTKEILKEVGMDDATIKNMIANGKAIQWNQ